MKTRFFVLTVAAIAVTSVAFYACNDSETENIPDPTPSDNRNITGYEDAFAVKYSDQSVLTLSQSITDPNIYNANYKGADYAVKYVEAGNALRMYDGGTLIFDHVLPAPTGNAWGDCSKLGARKPNETYKQCYERNFDNFCCDFTSCAAFAMFPVPVLTAIGASCLMTEGTLNIDEIINLRTGEVVYDRSNED